MKTKVKRLSSELLKCDGITYKRVPRKPMAPCVKAEGWLWDGVDTYKPVKGKK